MAARLASMATHGTLRPVSFGCTTAHKLASPLSRAAGSPDHLSRYLCRTARRILLDHSRDFPRANGYAGREFDPLCAVRDQYLSANRCLGSPHLYFFCLGLDLVLCPFEDLASSAYLAFGHDLVFAHGGKHWAAPTRTGPAQRGHRRYRKCDWFCVNDDLVVCNC